MITPRLAGHRAVLDALLVAREQLDDDAYLVLLAGLEADLREGTRGISVGVTKRARRGAS